jgi:hypothetical protein
LTRTRIFRPKCTESKLDTNSLSIEQQFLGGSTSYLEIGYASSQKLLFNGETVGVWLAFIEGLADERSEGDSEGSEDMVGAVVDGMDIAFCLHRTRMFRAKYDSHDVNCQEDNQNTRTEQRPASSVGATTFHNLCLRHVPFFSNETFTSFLPDFSSFLLGQQRDIFLHNNKLGFENHASRFCCIPRFKLEITARVLFCELQGYSLGRYLWSLPMAIPESHQGAPRIRILRFSCLSERAYFSSVSHLK